MKQVLGFCLYIALVCSLSLMTGCGVSEQDGFDTNGSSDYYEQVKPSKPFRKRNRFNNKRVVVEHHHHYHRGVNRGRRPRRRSGRHK